MVPDAAFPSVVFWMVLTNGHAERHGIGHDRVEVTSPADVATFTVTSFTPVPVIAEPVEDSACLQDFLVAQLGRFFYAQRGSSSLAERTG